MTAPIEFTGLIVPTLTPLNVDEHLDVDSATKHLRFLLEAGVDGLFVLGSSGEGPMLRTRDRLAVIDHALETVNGAVPLLGGILEVSTTRIIEELQALRGRGLTGYVVTTPLYFDGFSEDGLFDHFARIADAADKPVMLYSIPQFTHVAMSEKLIRRLAQLPNIVGLKDSSGNWPLFQALLMDRPAEGFALLQGFQHMSAISMFCGADGLVPGYANLHPALLREIMDAADAQDWPAGLAAQRRLNGFLRFRGPATVHGSKSIGQALGLMHDHVTAPLARMDDETVASLLRAAVEAGLLLPAE